MGAKGVQGVSEITSKLMTVYSMEKAENALEKTRMQNAMELKTKRLKMIAKDKCESGTKRGRHSWWIRFQYLFVGTLYAAAVSFVLLILFRDLNDSNRAGHFRVINGINRNLNSAILDWQNCADCSEDRLTKNVHAIIDASSRLAAVSVMASYE